jgi:hypothetical protein
VGLSAEFRKRGWLLYLTGNKDTNRRLLIAANQAKLNWSLISDANPAIWLRDFQEPPAADKQQRIPSISTEKEKAPDSEAQTEEQKPKVVQPAKAQDKEIIRVGQPTVEEEEQTTEISQQHSVEPAKKDGKPGTPGYEFKTEVDYTVSITHPDPKTTTLDTTLPEDQPQEPNEPMPDLIEEIAIEQPEALPEPTTPVETEPEPNEPAVEAETRISWRRVLWWVLPPVLLVLVVMAFILFRSMDAARQYTRDVNSRLKNTQRQDAGFLLATVNGRSYNLGPSEHFKTADFGRGGDNTVRIPDDSLQNRHMRIFKRRASLMVRNLARSPIMVNGTAVKRSGTCHLVIPSVIKLNDKVSVDLRIQSQPKQSKPNRSLTHETSKQ